MHVDEFDLDRYLRASGRIDLSAVAWDRIGERRHFAFYRAQARMRLARSARARRVTRWVMEHLWDPVATGVRPQQETDFVLASLR